MKLQLLLVMSFFAITLSAQKTCNTPKEDVLEDLASITKCSIESSKTSKSKRSRQISVRVSAPKKRFLKKRSAASNTDLNSSGIAMQRKNKMLALKKDVASLTKSLSASELKSAEKFTTVDEVPTFVKCKTSKGDERLDCFNQEMVRHISSYFKYPSVAVRDHIEGEVWVRFIIDKEGNVTNLKVLGPDGGDLLVEEAIRVVSYLPNFVPAEKGGEKVSVKYGFPINFSLQE